MFLKIVEIRLCGRKERLVTTREKWDDNLSRERRLLNVKFEILLTKTSGSVW